MGPATERVRVCGWNMSRASRTASSPMSATDSLPWPGSAAIAAAAGAWRPLYCRPLKSELPSTLLWKVDSNFDRPQDRFGQDYAPTWSWASVPGPIRPKHRRSEDTTPICTLCNAYTGVPTTANPFGPTRRASITVLDPVWEFDLNNQVMDVDALLLKISRAGGYIGPPRLAMVAAALALVRPMEDQSISDPLKVKWSTAGTPTPPS